MLLLVTDTSVEDVVFSPVPSTSIADIVSLLLDSFSTVVVVAFAVVVSLMSTNNVSFDAIVTFSTIVELPSSSVATLSVPLIASVISLAFLAVGTIVGLYVGTQDVG